MTNYASTLDISRFINDIHRRVEDSGVSVRIDPKAETAYTTGDSVVLTTFALPMTQRDFEIKRGQSIHEVGHIKRPESFKIIKEVGLDMKHPLMSIMNMIEDAVQERQQAAEYRGDMRALSDLHKHHTDDQIKYWEDVWKEHGDKGLDDKTIKLAAAHAISKEANNDWNIGANLKLRTLTQTISLEAEALWNILQGEDWSYRVKECDTPQETWQLSKELYARLFNKDADEEIEQQQRCKKGKSSGKGKSSDEGKSSCKGGEVPGTSSEELIEIPWEKVMISNHDHTGSPQASRINWETKKSSTSYSLYPPDMIETLDMSKDRESAGRKLVIPLDARLVANKVRQLIQANQRTLWRTDLKHGKINYSALYRRRMPRVGNGEWNRKMFKKKRQAPEINTAVTLLVDWSGSMCGPKMKHAATATVIMSEIFSRIIRVPVEILMFSVSHSNKLAHGIVKDFRHPSVPQDEIARRMYAFEKYTGGNADADALQWAARRLLHRPEERKICIVLSDGSPAEAWDTNNEMSWGDADAALTDTVNDIRKHTDIELHGIGIMDRNVQRYYGKNAQTIKNSSELPECLINTLKRVVL